MSDASAGEGLFVRDLMTEDPVVVQPEVSVGRVLGLMQEAAIRHVPVVDEAGIVGVVNDTDLSFIHGMPGVFDRLSDRDVENLLEAPVGVVMKSRFLVKRDVVVIGADDLLEKAVDAMLAHRVRALPVVDEEQKLVGMLSAVDVLRWVSDEVLPIE